jgi:hypothetical protein
MVDLLIIQTIGVIVAASSVLLYIINLLISGKREERNKKIQMSNTLLQTLMSTERTRDSAELLNYQWNDIQDYLSKYDSSANPKSFSQRMSTFNIFETMGYLLKQGLVDKEFIYVVGGSTSIFLWAKFKPIMVEYRKLAYGSDMFSYFEYLAKEMWVMKRERDPSFVKDQTIGLDFLNIFES